MSEHEQRVINECVELEAKIDKLIDFTNSDLYKSLDLVEQGLLMMQKLHMDSYSNVLRDRIQRFQFSINRGSTNENI
jgi:SUMO ligase MMS21 Smc5/6 complex component